jgi:ADP-heptose:LPS heptosyltransferase
VIHPFSGSKGKNWPLPNYEALASRINRAKIEWTAGPEEVLRRATRFENLAGLASWLRGARLYIGNDSGITHLAAAVGVPTLALFGPTDPARWAPRGENVTLLRNNPIEDLSVASVLEAANQRLSSLSKDSST